MKETLHPPEKWHPHLWDGIPGVLRSIRGEVRLGCLLGPLGLPLTDAADQGCSAASVARCLLGASWVALDGCCGRGVLRSIRGLGSPLRAPTVLHPTPFKLAQPQRKCIRLQPK